MAFSPPNKRRTDFSIISVLLLIFIALACGPTFSFATKVKWKVGEITLKGNKRTKAKVILREITFSPGDTITGEDIELSKQKLRNLGLFSKIGFVSGEPSPDGTISVTISLKEKWSILPLPILSRSSDADVKVGARYEDFNLFGTGNYLRIKSYRNWANDFENDLGGYYSIGVETKNILGKDVIFSPDFNKGKALEEKYENGEIISQYIKRLASYSVRLGKKYDNYTVGISHAGSRNKYNLLSGLPQPYIDIVIRSMGLFVNYNNVNDLGQYTYKGYASSFSITKFDEAVGSDINATSYNATFTHFIPHGSKKYFAYRLQGAIVTGNKVEDVLLGVGGSTSLRGYESGEFKGDRMLRFNSEYRFPITKKYWGGILFVDGGNAWQEKESMHIDDFNLGVGCGLRLFIKQLVQGIGRIDFAYNVSQKSYRGYMGVRHTF